MDGIVGGEARMGDGSSWDVIVVDYGEDLCWVPTHETPASYTAEQIF